MLRSGVQTLCMAVLLLAFASGDVRADCPAAPIGNPDDMVISFLKTSGVQVASGSMHASTVKEGMLVYDDTADKLKLCDGNNWIDVGSGSGTDTLASLSCATGEIAKFNGSAWVCAADGGGGVPTGTIAAFATMTCPDGWTEYMPARGRFLRGIDNGAGNDPDGTRSPGDTQADDIKAIPHPYLWNAAGYNGGMTPGGAFMTRLASQVAPSGWPNGDETRPKNVAVLFCQYTGSGGGGGSDTLAGLSCSSGEIPKWNSSAWACAADEGGTATAAGDAGQIQFNDGADNLAADAGLFWDDINKRMGIGTSAPETGLHIHGGNVNSIKLTSSNTAYYSEIINNVDALKAFEIKQGGITFFRARSGGANNGLFLGQEGFAQLVISRANTASYFPVGNVGIGTTMPEANLVTVSSAIAQSRGIMSSQYNDGLQAALFVGKKARGTLLAPTAVLANDYTVALQGVGYDGTSFSTSRTTIASLASENWTTTANGSYTVLFTTPKTTTLSLERVRIDHNGNVGIGTTTPASKLHVAGGIQLGDDTATCPGALDIKLGTLRFNSGILQLCGASGWTDVSLGGSASSPMVSGWPDGIVCKNGATVWIMYYTTTNGTTVGYHSPYSSAANVVTVGFKVDKTYNSQTGLSGYDCVNKPIAQLYSEGKAFNFIGDTASGGSPAGNDGSIQFKAGSNFEADAANLHWDNVNKRLGIGTAAPRTHLDVNGYISGGFGAQSTVGTLNWNSSSNARSGNAQTLLLGSASNGPGGEYFFYPFSFEYGRTDGAGNLTQLAVSYADSAGTLNNGALFMRGRYEGVWTSWYRFTTAMISDYRAKTNVHPITEGLDLVMKMKPVRFEYKKDAGPSGARDGFIADQMQAIAPYSVTGTKDAVDADGKPTYQSMDYGQLTPLLTSAIQQLKADNDNQAQAIDELRREIDMLKAAVNQ